MPTNKRNNCAAHTHTHVHTLPHTALASNIGPKTRWNSQYNHIKDISQSMWVHSKWMRVLSLSHTHSLESRISLWLAVWILLLLLFICTFLPSEARSAMSLAVEMRSLLNMCESKRRLFNVLSIQYSIFNYLFTWGLLALLFAARTRRQLKEWNGNTPAITTSLHDNDDDDRARHDAHTHTRTHRQMHTHSSWSPHTVSYARIELYRYTECSKMATGFVRLLMRCTTNAAAFSTQTDCQLAASRLGNLVRNVVELEHHTDSASSKQKAASSSSSSSSSKQLPHCEWVSFPATFAGGNAARAFLLRFIACEKCRRVYQ